MKRRTITIKGQKVEVEGEGHFTLPYYEEDSIKLEGIALIPMNSIEQFPYSVFEFLEDQKKNNPNYRPRRKDLEQFFYIEFSTAEELARRDRMFYHYLRECDLIGRQ